MSISRNTKMLIFVILATILLASFTKAQSVVFVSAKNGADGNPCTLAAPCRSLAFAHSTVTSNGRIVIIDSGNYAELTITKSVSVETASGVTAVLNNPSASTLIAVIAGSTDKVALRGLHLKGATTNSFGLRFNSGASLLVENCMIEGASSAGVIITTPSLFSLQNSVVRGNLTGISLAPASAGLQRTIIDRSLIEKNTSNGIDIVPVDTAIVDFIARNANFSYNGGAGLRGISGLSQSSVNGYVDGCILFGNQIGIRAERNGTGIFVSNTTIFGNGTGISLANVANVFTRVNNTLEGNTINGAFTEFFTVQ